MESFKLSDEDPAAARAGRSFPVSRAFTLLVIFGVAFGLVTRAGHPALVLPPASLAAVLFWLRRRRRMGAARFFDTMATEEERLAAGVLQEDLAEYRARPEDQPRKQDLNAAGLLRSEIRDPDHSR